jgi:molecular chaperone GrpE
MEQRTMDDTRTNNDAPPGNAGTADPQAANENAAQGAASEATRPSLEEQLAAAQAEAAENKDKALRALAEAENVRRRLQRERDDAVKYGISNFAKDLLSAADNLRRAIASLPEAQVKDEATKSLLAGVAATERELLAALEKHGVRRLDPKGERFDHNLHQAIFEAENTGQPAGTIVEVLQPGYVLHDRLLRPAMVGVAKAGASEPRKPGEFVDTRA